MKDIKPTMMLTSLMLDQSPSFQLIPLTKECPYVEVLYIPQDNSLVVLNTQKKVKYHFVPRIDENGDLVASRSKINTERKFKEQREKTEMFHEHYIQNSEEIITFVEAVAINTETFDYKKFLNLEPVKSTKKK